MEEMTKEEMQRFLIKEAQRGPERRRGTGSIQKSDGNSRNRVSIRKRKSRMIGNGQSKGGRA